MVSNEHPNEANKLALTNEKPGHLNQTSSKPNSSNKATHGSFTPTSAGSGQERAGNWGGNRVSNAGNGQRDAWALQKWLEQSSRDEPWSAESRRS